HAARSQFPEWRSRAMSRIIWRLRAVPCLTRPFGDGWKNILTRSEQSQPTKGWGAIGRLIGEAEERQATAAGILLFFLLFASYFMLRPVRETFGIAGGVHNLQWLFTGTFLATLLVVPLFGWAAARLRRRLLAPLSFILSAAVMAGF